MIDLEEDLSLNQSTLLTKTFDLPIIKDYFLFIPLVACLVCSTTVTSIAMSTFSLSVGNTEISGTTPETGTLRAAGLHLAAAFPWLTCQGLAQPSGMKSPVPFAQ